MSGNSKEYEGSQLYRIRHSAAHVMAEAVLEKFPTGRGAIGPPIEDGFYYDFDLPRTLTPEDLAEIRRQIVQVKRFRRLIQQGRFTRLLSPFENRLAAWQFADEGQGEVLLCVFQRYAAANPADCFIPVRDIDENALYRDDAGKVYSGGVLKYQGYRAPFGQEGFREDHDSVVLHLTRVDGRA